MRQFFGDHDLGAGKRAAEQALEIVETNVYMMDKLSNDLLKAFKKKSS